MLFCKKCGSVLLPKKEGSKKILICPRCNFKTKEITETKIKEKIKQKKPLEIIEEEKETHPIIEIECPKCKNNEAYFWTIQTRGSDEPETRFYKCTKCKYIWREYK